jgi:hypothetical protein
MSTNCSHCGDCAHSLEMHNFHLCTRHSKAVMPAALVLSQAGGTCLSFRDRSTRSLSEVCALGSEIAAVEQLAAEIAKGNVPVETMPSEAPAPTQTERKHERQALGLL